MLNWKMFLFQDFSSINFMFLVYFHDFLMLVILLILFMVLYIMIMLVMNSMVSLNISQSHTIELVWTFMPMFILLMLAIPSIQILYLMEENYLCALTIKCIGHQWYWSYEYSDFSDLFFDSYVLSSLEIDSFRLLDVDNRCVIPYNAYCRILVSSDDVIHSWTIPSLGVKLDAVPGRLSQLSFFLMRLGLFYGQCSEICGINHSFMPIVIESVEFESFMSWLNKN